MLLKSQQEFASAYKDMQRLIWNFQTESSTKKMLIITSDAETSTERCKVNQILIHRKMTYSR